MKNQTDMMREILTNETAQRIINFVSPIYGNSYVGLWIYQAIGSTMDEICKIAQQLKYEANPATSSLLLDKWEEHYGIQKDSSMTVEQRRGKILSKIQERHHCTPAIMSAAISAALNGVEVDIEENVAKNTFKVFIREYVESIAPAVDVVERMKPAHLVYQMQVVTRTVAQSEIDVAIAMTRAEMFKVEVKT